MFNLTGIVIEAGGVNPVAGPMVLVDPVNYKLMVAVCEAAERWADWHGQGSTIVPMQRPIRELHQVVRALKRQGGTR